MSKKNKKKNNQTVSSFFMDFSEPEANEGDLRFFQRKVVGGKYSFWKDKYSIEHESAKTLQIFRNGEWTDVPFEREYINV